MYDFTSFDVDDFKREIKEKDYLGIKIDVINTIRNNPGFDNAIGENCSEADIILDILREKTPEIFEEYSVRNGEREYNEAEYQSWDKDYFIEQSFYLERNFCEERYEIVKKIGRWLKKGINPNFPEPQELSQEQGKKKKQQSVPMYILMAVIALVVIIIVAVKMIQD